MNSFYRLKIRPRTFPALTEMTGKCSNYNVDGLSKETSSVYMYTFLDIFEQYRCNKKGW